MRMMGLEAIYPKPGTSRPHPENKVYPYLLRNMPIDGANQMWTADIPIFRVMSLQARWYQQAMQ
jgi:putative transposase